MDSIYIPLVFAWAIIIWAIIFGIVIRLINGKRARAKEATLPVDSPTKCPKCGHHKDKPNSMGHCTPDFHDPRYRKRNSWTGNPEHLSYSCWSCGHQVKTTPETND